MTIPSARATGRASRFWLLPALAAAAIVALPLIVVLANGLLPDNGGWQHLSETVLLTYLRNTFVLLLLVGLLSLAIGVGTAWLIAACEFPGRGTLSWLLMLPLAAPAYVVAYAYTDVLDVSGPLQNQLRSILKLGIDEFALRGIRSLPSAAAMLAIVLYPYVYLLCRASFAGRAAAPFEAARVLGLTAFQAFVRVALPAARPALAGGLALVLMETLADFGVVDYFALPTFSTGIYRSWISLGERQTALRLAALLLLFVLTLLVFESAGRRGRPEPRELSRAARIRLSGWRARLATLACALPVTLGFAIPCAILLTLKFTTGGDPLFGRRFIDYAGNSVSVSAAAALTATLLAVLMAYSQRQRPGRLGDGLIRLGTLGYALPGMVLAVGLLGPLGTLDRNLTVWLRDHLGYGGGLVVSGTTVLLVYAYVCRFLTVSYNSVHSGFADIPEAMDAAARSLGASRGDVLRRIHLPLIRPSVLAAALLVFVDAMRELPATLMLRPFNFDTLATRVYRLASDERLAEASTAALTIVLLGTLPVLLLNRLGRRR